MQDGFLTTHTVESVRLAEPEFMKEFVGQPEEKLMNLMDPANPMMSGVVQNQDSYMKGKIAQRWYYDRVAPALTEAFDEFRRQTGRSYDFVGPYRCDDAEYILVGMGSYMETAQATVDYLREQGRAGRLPEHLLLPPVSGASRSCKRSKHCTAFSVLERMDDPLSTTGNHLTREIKAAFCDAMLGQNGCERDRSDSADLLRLRRAGEPRRAPRRHHRDLRQHDSRRAGLLLRRHEPSACARTSPTIPTCAPAARSRCADIRSAGSAR